MQVRLIADLRRHLPPDASGSVATLSLAPGAIVSDALVSLGLPEPDAYVVLCNGRDVQLDAPLQHGDQLAAFPRLAGG